MAIRNKTCIKCGSKDTAEIIYGLPKPELYSLEEEKKVVLGGSCILIESKTFPLIDAKGRVIGEYNVEFFTPDYFCSTCKHEWNKEQAIYHAYSQIERLRLSVGSFSDSYKIVEIDFIDRTL